MKSPLSRTSAVLLACLLELPLPSAVQACLHGATGLEQTAVVRGTAREEKLVGRWDGQSRSILKLFVGPAGALPEVSVLDQAALKEHADLATHAAQIGSEGTRGGFGGGEDYTTKNGIKINVSDVTNRSWQDIAQHYGVTASGGEQLDSLPLWIAKIREEHRGLFAVSIDMSAARKNPAAGAEQDAYALAATFRYPNDAEAAVLKDKFLEYFTAWEVPMIVRFPDGGKKAADALAAVIGNDPDVNDPKPAAVTAMPGRHGGDGAFDIALDGNPRALGTIRVRGTDVYFYNPGRSLTKRSGPQASTAPPAASQPRLDAKASAAKIRAVGSGFGQ